MMDPDFWQQRWTQDLIGFHQQEANRYLQKYIDVLGHVTGSTVLVPLCGKSLDMWWLYHQGFKVLGVELSPIACESFFREAKRSACQVSHGAFVSWKWADVEILCGDYFDLDREMLHDVRAVYDRAALIALPPEMRKRYVMHLAGILAPGVKGLLVTMEYPQGEMHGPPFSVPEGEVLSLYEKDFDIALLEDVDVLAANARFRDRGLSAMREKIYRIERR